MFVFVLSYNPLPPFLLGMVFYWSNNLLFHLHSQPVKTNRQWWMLQGQSVHTDEQTIWSNNNQVSSVVISLVMGTLQILAGTTRPERRDGVCSWLDWDGQAAVIFTRTVDWRPLDVQQVFEGIQPGPTCMNHSIFIFSHTRFITHESTCEIEVVTWFMSKWKLMDGPRLWGFLLRAMTLQILSNSLTVSVAVIVSYWLITDNCLTASMTDWDCVLLCLTLQQCLIS